MQRTQSWSWTRLLRTRSWTRKVRTQLQHWFSFLQNFREAFQKLNRDSTQMKGETSSSKNGDKCHGRELNRDSAQMMGKLSSGPKMVTGVTGGGGGLNRDSAKMRRETSSGPKMVSGVTWNGEPQGGGYSNMIWVGTCRWDLKSRPIFIPNFAKKLDPFLNQSHKF